QVAVGFEDQVVGAVKALAHVIVGENGLLAVLFNTADAAVAVLAQDQPALRVERQAVGAGFVAGLAAARLLAGVAARLEVLRDPLLGGVLVDDVVRDVGEEQVAAVLDPDRPLDPDEALGHLDELGAGRDQFVE